MSLRAFVALDLGESMRGRLRSLLVELGNIRGARWVRPEGIHLTLRFLGDTTPDVVAGLEPHLAAAAATCPPTEASVSGLGLFPERGAPRVLWIGIAVPEPVMELQAACEGAAVAAGLAPERRPFRPHLTLARFRDRVPRPSLPPADLGSTSLDSLVLFRSDLRPGGAVYTPLASFPLGCRP